MSPEEFNTKMRRLAHSYFYEEDKDLRAQVKVSRAFIEAANLMVIALAENGFDKGVFKYKNFIEE